MARTVRALRRKNVGIPEHLSDRLADYSARTGVDGNSLIILALYEYLERVDDLAPESEAASGRAE